MASPNYQRKQFVAVFLALRICGFHIPCSDSLRNPTFSLPDPPQEERGNSGVFGTRFELREPAFAIMIPRSSEGRALKVFLLMKPSSEMIQKVYFNRKRIPSSVFLKNKFIPIRPVASGCPGVTQPCVPECIIYAGAWK